MGHAKRIIILIYKVNQIQLKVLNVNEITKLLLNVIQQKKMFSIQNYSKPSNYPSSNSVS
jgi:hypothetical protein